MNNILISSAGRRVSLVKFFKEEVKKIGNKDVKVFTTDLVPNMSSACLVSDEGFKVGRFSNNDYMPKLLELCLRNDIKLVIPTIDSELQLLSAHRSSFLEHGIELMVSDQYFINICRDKRKTNQLFQEKDIKVPAAVDRNNLSFPLFIKPIDGSNSKNIYLIESEKMLSPYLMEREDLMFMEYLPKDKYTEYTVDMYYNKEGHLCCAVPRIRIEVRGGEVNKSITRKNDLLPFLVERFKVLSGVRGCITLQCFLNNEDNSIVYGIEINPRFGGGYPLSYWAGANYPNLLMREYLLGESIKYDESWAADTMMLRYDEDYIVKDAIYG